MARVIKETQTIEDDTVSTIDRPTTSVEPATWTVARVIYLIAGIILALLLMRFLLSLLGANRGNGFADFVYSTSQPFVAPFFGLFSYQTQYGVARFEVETLVAMVVYGLLSWFLVNLVTMGDRRRTPSA